MQSVGKLQRRNEMETTGIMGKEKVQLHFVDVKELDTLAF